MLRKFSYDFVSMGCPCGLVFYADSQDQADALFGALYQEMDRLDRYYTNYTSTSFTAQINLSAGNKKGIRLDDETSHLLTYAQTCFQKSGGLFDITAGILRRAWDYQNPHPRLPDPALVQELLTLVGFDKLIWNPPHLILPLEGMLLDFGGVVKEYAADVGAALCMRHGVTHGFVDMGGDMAIFGPHPDGSGWTIGLKHPLNPQDNIAVFKVRKGGLASSGTYERYFKIDGVRYSHILNPKTGWPAQGVSTASVIAPHCLVAGSLSTVALLSEGKDTLQGLGLPYCLVDPQGGLIGAQDMV